MFANVDHFDIMLSPTIQDNILSKWSILTRWFGHKISKTCQFIIQSEDNTDDCFTIVSRSESKTEGRADWYIHWWMN